MVFVAVLIFFAVLEQVVSAQGFFGASIALEVLMGITALCGIFTQFNARLEQVQDFEQIKEAKGVEDILKEKAEVLTAEFVKHLAQAYPEHEKGIFEKIGPEKVAVYFAKYPELKASEVLLNLVDRINGLQSSVYNQRITVENLLAKTRTRLRDPWY